MSRNPRTTRRWIIAAGAAAALVIIVIIGVALVLVPRAASADDVARDYFAALQGDDATHVLEHVDGGAAAHSDAAAAFAGATGRISDVRADAAVVEGDTARVHAVATLAGEDRTLDIAMTRAGGQWRIDDGFLGAVTVTASVGDAVRIGDATLQEGALELLPAQYDVHGAPADLVDGDATVDVAPDRPATLELTTSLSPDALARAQQQVDAYVASCTAPATTVPDDCGLRVPWAADLRRADGFAYRVERSPQLRVGADGVTFVADGGVLVATVTGEARSGGAASVTYRDDAWTLRGTLVLDADGLTLEVR